MPSAVVQVLPVFLIACATSILLNTSTTVGGLGLAPADEANASTMNKTIERVMDRCSPHGRGAAIANTAYNVAMKALGIRRYKAAMEMLELPRPEPGPGDLLVR